MGWVAQIAAHKYFEGNAPALLENLQQGRVHVWIEFDFLVAYVEALVLAPYFVVIELLFFFGYNPELQAAFQKRVKELKAERNLKDNK